MVVFLCLRIAPSPICIGREPRPAKQTWFTFGTRLSSRSAVRKLSCRPVSRARRRILTSMGCHKNALFSRERQVVSHIPKRRHLICLKLENGSTSVRDCRPSLSLKVEATTMRSSTAANIGIVTNEDLLLCW